MWREEREWRRRGAGSSWPPARLPASIHLLCVFASVGACNLFEAGWSRRLPQPSPLERGLGSERELRWSRPAFRPGSESSPPPPAYPPKIVNPSHSYRHSLSPFPYLGSVIIPGINCNAIITSMVISVTNNITMIVSAIAIIKCIR